MKHIQLFGFLFLIISLAQPAHAYLDPGTGSFILQMMIAGVMGALFTIKIYWYKLKVFVARKLGKEVADSEDEDEGDDDELEAPEKTDTDK